jgi:hypothetical protein
MTYIPNEWFFTPVIGKSPILDGWQNLPCEYSAIEQEKYGIGLLLGPTSGGTVAIDFDGPEAFEFFKSITSIELPNSPRWTSGKESRMQAAFKVEEQFWSFLRTKKTGPNKKLEFRWRSSQSVIPPSPHPETDGYRWVIEPTEENTRVMLPDELLAFWFEECIKQGDKEINQNYTTTALPIVGNDDLRRILEELRRVVNRPCYDDWLTITWAAFRHAGYEGVGLVKEVFGVEKPGEYEKLINEFDTARAKVITVASLFWLIKQNSGNIQLCKSPKERLVSKLVYLEKKSANLRRGY